MAKKRPNAPKASGKYKPGSRGEARELRAIAGKLARIERGQQSAAHWGKMGYQATQGGTKRGPDTAKNTIVVVNPQNPQQGRIVRVGKRGGVYGTGGTPKTRWGDTSVMMGIVKALPGAALLTSSVAMGSLFFKDNKTIGALKKKTPGGGNGLAFIGGAAGMYVAYKYKSLITFLAGMGVAAYALIKFSDKEANLLDEDGALDEDDEPTPASAQLPAAQDPVIPAKTPTVTAEEKKKAEEKRGNLLIDAGNVQMKNDNFRGAIDSYRAGSALLGDNAEAVYMFNIGLAYKKLALRPGGEATINKGLAKNAIVNLETFIALAKPEEGIVTAGDLERLKGKAKDNVDLLRTQFFANEADEEETVAVGSRRGSQILVEGSDEDEDEEYDARDGDQELDDDDDVSGDDDDDDDYEADGYDDDDDEDGYQPEA